MITKKLTLGSLPASKKIYVESKKFSDVKVAMREIALSNKDFFTVYDPSGVYSDQNFLDKINLNKGLPKLRRQWILERGDVEFYEGREVRPEDNSVKVANTSPSAPSFDLSDFKYPNSSQVGNLENGIKLESSDDPNTITDWYQEKIRSLGFKSKSFVKTNTNGNILNKLVAASANKEVRVEIEKSAEVSKVSIAVTLIAT